SGHLLARMLGFGPPLLAALGDRGDLVLEAFNLRLEVLVLALPAIAALSEEPDQGAGSALVVLTSRSGVGFRGGIHASVLCRDGPKTLPSPQRNKESTIPQAEFVRSIPTLLRPSARLRPSLFWKTRPEPRTPRIQNDGVEKTRPEPRTPRIQNDGVEKTRPEPRTPRIQNDGVE